MSRSLTAGMQSALSADNVAPILLAKINTTGGDVRVWTGIGDLTFDSEVYVGIGTFGNITEIIEDADLGASGLTLSLSGIPSDMVSIAFSQIQHNRPATIWFGALDTTTGALIADPYQMFSGFTDVPVIEDNAITSVLKLTVENRMIDLNRPRTRRYTPEDQKIDFSDDEGFAFVAALQDKSIDWGKV